MAVGGADLRQPSRMELAPMIVPVTSYGTSHGTSNGTAYRPPDGTAAGTRRRRPRSPEAPPRTIREGSRAAAFPRLRGAVPRSRERVGRPAAGGGRTLAMDERREQVTRILHSKEPHEELFPLVYDELRSIAAGRMGGERRDHTLQATALVHEAYMKLVGDVQVSWRDRGHFYAAASEAMRRILIDHARRMRSLKRGGDRERVTLGAPQEHVELAAEDLIALGDALDALEREDERAAAVARLRFLSGLSVEETARVLEISERSVHREWTFARARLFELLGEGGEGA